MPRPPTPNCPEPRDIAEPLLVELMVFIEFEVELEKEFELLKLGFRFEFVLKDSVFEGIWPARDRPAKVANTVDFIS